MASSFHFKAVTPDGKTRTGTITMIGAARTIPDNTGIV
jgi:hypothetical protein